MFGLGETMEFLWILLLKYMLAYFLLRMTYTGEEVQRWRGQTSATTISQSGRTPQGDWSGSPIQAQRPLQRKSRCHRYPTRWKNDREDIKEGSLQQNFTMVMLEPFT